MLGGEALGKSGLLDFLRLSSHKGLNKKNNFVLLIIFLCYNMIVLIWLFVYIFETVLYLH